jgi:D-beta-D-heptose 7-phosphate kinase/D-beta-D-heptose 1-phosphate adenosyltransferase
MRRIGLVKDVLRIIFMSLNVPDFSYCHLLIVGDVMLDRYWHGSCHRISPEAPVPVVNIVTQEERPGGAANVAINMTSIGCNVHVLGVTGTDEAARSLTDKLKEYGVEHNLIQNPGNMTITKLRVLSQHQQLLRIDFENGFLDFDTPELLSRFKTYLPSADVVVLSDYGKGTLNEVQNFIQCARLAGRPVLIDPKGHDFSRYRGATLITPNVNEFQAVVGPCSSEAELERKGRILISDLELDALLITRSEKGMTLLQRQGDVLHLPARAQEVFDVTGAGDTVIAVLGACLAAGLKITEATRFANQAAGIVVGKLGAASVSITELNHLSCSSASSTIFDEVRLLERVKISRQYNEKIVMTNGCFDILHAGHLSYLEQARQLGDRLIVAVNDDASVRRLKGESRPVNGLSERMRVLAGLKAVDWVVPFYEDTPERLICLIKPDFLVKGGDNDPSRIPGNHCVWDAGGEVVVMDYVEGCSTSRIIDRILRRV